MIIEHEENPEWSVPRQAADVTVDAVEDILRRYPKVLPAEVERAVMFLSTAPILQRGSLSSRPGMQEKMDQLRLDHPKAFRPSMTGYLIAGMLVATVVIIAFLIADIG
ncbi:hypothetical protein P1X14_14550 [Sphingomonas sp. AOB5]|uniref:hypothetical protein n=1 Tax=Sphingomonas sp. AOB5 TaxID=3034017 RepID=UPI0023F7DAD2|nr:hypothetical protein [Sphingomonas sp. AOB5]MDF7776472.1 hypothetical protein [Sphingomonas sp. AOB5]